jgi:hypothetical protein
MSTIFRSAGPRIGTISPAHVLPDEGLAVIHSAVLIFG